MIFEMYLYGYSSALRSFEVGGVCLLLLLSPIEVSVCSRAREPREAVSSLLPSSQNSEKRASTDP
jgi:hypothetical protein